MSGTQQQPQRQPHQPRQPKVIRMGTGAHARVAQACDRCRSKKIRCDGKQPRCTSCSSVGFECRTSDKLSRRAFPRGYTESLEQRVIALEAAMHELEALVQTKDAEIEQLKGSSSANDDESRASGAAAAAAVANARAHSDGFAASNANTIQPAPVLRLPTEASPFQGPSSTKSFLYSLQAKAALGPKPCSFSVEALLTVDWPSQQQSAIPDMNQPDPVLPDLPKPMSDELLHTFFSEWAPLFPVLHRPTSQGVYEHVSREPLAFSKLDMIYITAHLNLMYAIATFSSKSHNPRKAFQFERAWEQCANSLTNDISLPALQCVILAQIYYLVKADYRAVLKYRGMGMIICHGLGLHQSQEAFHFNALETEMRKRAFWCQYTLDRLAAALIGIPYLIKDSEISCELPLNVEDSQITANGIIPLHNAMPGNNMSISPITVALEFFKAARILGKTLSSIYPALSGSDVRICTMHTLVGELQSWASNLPEFLRPRSIDERPNLHTMQLTILYHYIRCLIRRPLVCFSQGSETSSSIIQSVESGKEILRMLQYMEDKSINLCLGINRRELLLVSTATIAWQLTDIGLQAKPPKDSAKTLMESLGLFTSEPQPVYEEMRTLLDAVIREGQSAGPDGRPAYLDGATAQHSLGSLNTTGRRAKSISGSTPLQAPGAGPYGMSATVAAAPSPQNTQVQFPQYSSLPTSSSIPGWGQMGQEYTARQQQPLPGRMDLDMSSPALSHVPQHSLAGPTRIANITAPTGRPPSISTSDGRGNAHINGEQARGSEADDEEVEGEEEVEEDSADGREWSSLLSKIDSGRMNIFNRIYGGSEAAPDTEQKEIGSLYRQGSHRPI